MPVSATRAADFESRSTSFGDCHQRLDRLERDLTDLANAVKQLQTVVSEQTRAIQQVNNNLEQYKLSGRP